MTTGTGSLRRTILSAHTAQSAFVALLLVMGLVMAPVSCTCGSSIPHGHSLFQLPHHHHGSVDTGHSGDLYTEHRNSAAKQNQAMTTGVSVKKSDCDSLNHPDTAPESYIALSNMTEKHDGYALKAPPSSSIGQPISITQPALITLSAQKCVPVTLPAVRILEGTETSPETPPPRGISLI